MPSTPTHAVPDVPTLSGRGSERPADVLVIGAGLGGAAAAAVLATRGRRVRVVEKNDAVGGILAAFHHDGFKVDRASQLVARGARGPIGALLRELRLPAPRLLTHPVPMRSRGMFAIAAPSRRLGLLATAREAVGLLRVPRRDTWRLARLFASVLLWPESRLARWDAVPLHDLVHRHTDHPGAYFLLSFLASIFFVLPPWEVSAGAALRALRGVLRSYALSYVEGGPDRLVHALLQRAVDAGGEVVTHARVTALTPDDGAWVATTDGGDAFHARAVASALAPAETLALLPPALVPPDWRAAVAALRGSGNAHQLAVGLDRPLFDEGCCIGGVSLEGRSLADLSLPLMERVVAEIAAGRCADPLALYAPIPTNFDASLGPPGTQLVIASLYGAAAPPPPGAPPADPPEVWRDRGLAALDQVAPGFRAATRFVRFTPIAAVGAWMGRRHPSAIATAQTPAQAGPGRPGVGTPLPGLVLCGDGAGGHGVGIELAATSGREAAHALDAWLDR